MERGHLELYLGPMGSGKSTRLATRLSCYRGFGLRALYVNYRGDTRPSHPSDSLSTHNPLLKTNVLPGLKVLALAEVDAAAADALAVDEAHFFPDLVPAVAGWLAAGKVVLVGGLPGTFRREPFGDLLRLVPLADECHFLRTECRFCVFENGGRAICGGAPAPFTRRLTADTALELIGGEDLYAAVCRKHYEAPLAELPGGPRVSPTRECPADEPPPGVPGG